MSLKVDFNSNFPISFKKTFLFGDNLERDKRGYVVRLGMDIFLTKQDFLSQVSTLLRVTIKKGFFGYLYGNDNLANRGILIYPQILLEGKEIPIYLNILNMGDWCYLKQGEDVGRLLILKY